MSIDVRWPETATPLPQRRALARQVIEQLQAELGFEPGFVLTPDRAEPHDRASIEAALGDRGVAFEWAIRGFGIATNDPSAAADVLQTMLDSDADQVSVVARERIGDESTAQLAGDLERVLHAAEADRAGLGRFVAIVFDWGEVCRVVRSAV